MRRRVAHHKGRPSGPTRPAHGSALKPYRLIVSDDPCKTLGQGEVRYFARIIDAASAFAKAPEPYKQILYDDGCTARHLNRDEQWMLESVCRILGIGVEDVGA